MSGPPPHKLHWLRAGSLQEEGYVSGPPPRKLDRLRAGSLQEEGGVSGPPPRKLPHPVVCSTPRNHERGDDS